jgi:hypothetical protein
MNTEFIVSIFLALALYRLSIPLLDRLSQKIWGNPNSAEIKGHSATRASGSAASARQ